MHNTAQILSLKNTNCSRDNPVLTFLLLLFTADVFGIRVMTGFFFLETLIKCYNPINLLFSALVLFSVEGRVGFCMPKY